MNLLKNLYDWIDVRLGVREIVNKKRAGYLLPSNINVWYSLGSILIVIFVIQIATGLLLMLYYVPDVDKAFNSVSFIMNEIPLGRLIRLFHAVGSSMMLLVLLLHMFSVLFMGSYKSPREIHWLTGFILFLLAMGISLTGYLLPWNQLSFWATTVATDCVGTIPLAGQYLVELLRGGKLVGDQTIGRFYTLHIGLLPAAITILIGIHLFLIQRTGVSMPPFGLEDTDKHWEGNKFIYEEHPGGIPFFPNFFLQDMVAISIYLACFMALVFFFPNLFIPSTAYLPANPYVTPSHIKPEWYFLANYQTLKLFPSEIIGLTVQAVAMTLMALLPFIDRGTERHPLKRPVFTTCAVGCILLWLGLTVWGYYS
ncbi:MAG: cytochrome bc complex cytochrome b subunit [Deltaproteobacteria bacterium]